MATMQGITGKLSGKMGAAVFRIRKGDQIVTQYNPVVSNPNTAGQQEKRAAFKLMSQLGAVMAPAFGALDKPAAGSKGAGTARNRFFQLNYPKIEVEKNQEGVIAKIPMEEIKLTDSFREYGYINSFGNMDPATDQGSITTEIVLATGSRVKKGKVALVGYGSMAVATTPTLIQVVDVPVVGESITYTFENLDPGKYTVLTYGLIPTGEGASRLDLDNIHTPDDEDFIAQVDLTAAVRDGLIAETMTIGANVTLV